MLISESAYFSTKKRCTGMSSTMEQARELASSAVYSFTEEEDLSHELTVSLLTVSSCRSKI